MVYQLQTVSLFSNWDSEVAKCTPSSSSSSSSITSPSMTRLNSAEGSNQKSTPLLLLTAATRHHTEMIYFWIIHSKTFSTEQNCPKDASVSANFVRHILTQSDVIKIYTPYDITSPRPPTTTIAFFGEIKKLFCLVEQSLNSKITLWISAT